MDSDVGTRNEVRERRRALAWQPGAIEPPIVLSALGLAPHETAALKGALCLVEAQLHVPVRYGDLDEAQIVVVPRVVLRDSRINTVLRGRKVIVYRHEADAPARAADISLVAPFRPQPLSAALNACFDQFGAAIRTAPRRPKAQPADDGEHVHGGTLAHALLRVFAQPHEHDAHVRVIGHGTLSILCHRGRYHIDFPESRLAAALQSRRFVVSGNCDEARQLKDARLRPLVELRWMAALSGYEHDVTTLPQRFQLVRWPEFGQLPHELDHLKLSALLSGRVLDVELACRVSAMDPAQVGAFLYACQVCGYLLPVEPRLPAAGRARSVAHPRSGLFARLLRHFSL